MTSLILAERMATIRPGSQRLKSLDHKLCIQHLFTRCFVDFEFLRSRKVFLKRGAYPDIELKKLITQIM